MASTAVDRPREAAALRRLVPADGFAFALTSITIVWLAASQGGYFPTSWGWAALALAWVAGLGLLLRQTRLGGREAAAVGALLLFVGWIALSTMWSQSIPGTVLEVERALVYVAGLLAVLLVASRRSVPNLLAGVALGSIGISCYSLATRLFPESLGAFDPIAGYRLSQPVGYWNALGIFAGMGALLSLGFAARARTLLARALAAAALPVLLATVYFTFSRGTWIALAAGIVASVALDSRRLQLVTAASALLVFPFVGVWLASRQDALTHEASTLVAASRAGDRLALWIALLAAGSAAVSLALALGERRFRPDRRVRLAYASLLTAIVVAGIVTVLVHYGGPVSLSQRIYDQFSAPPAAIGGDLNRRLFDLSGNGRVDMWRLALDDFRAHPELGSGAGSYEFFWLRDRPVPGQVRDAHSLYLEVLAELGPIGLALLVTAFAMPLVAVARVRRQPLLVGAIGAYCAYLVHAAVDWDWEVPVVTLSALFCGAAILVAARDEEARRSMPLAGRAACMVAAVSIGVFALVGLIGNSKLSSARAAADQGRWQAAEAEARSAGRWAPWSAAPWELRALAEVALGQLPAARASFREAIRRDPHDWSLWFGLAQASSGQARHAALAQALRLNPKSPELQTYQRAAGAASAGG